MSFCLCNRQMNVFKGNGWVGLVHFKKPREFWFEVLAVFLSSLKSPERSMVVHDAALIEYRVFLALALSNVNCNRLTLVTVDTLNSDNNLGLVSLGFSKKLRNALQNEAQWSYGALPVDTMLYKL